MPLWGALTLLLLAFLLSWLILLRRDGAPLPSIHRFRTELRTEPRIEPRTEPRTEPRAEPRARLQSEPEAKVEQWLNSDQNALCASPLDICLSPRLNRTLAIVTPTYYRSAGTTMGFLRRTAQGVLHQSYTKWRWYIIGDFYDDPVQGEAEIRSFLAELDDDRITWYNMPEPGERGKVPNDVLWYIAGATANNTGIEHLLRDGFDWYVHLDDDDLWTGDHLQTLVEGQCLFPEATVVYTQAQYTVCPFPASTFTQPTLQQPPIPCGAIHSSLCFNVRHWANIRYRTDVFDAGDSVLLRELLQSQAVSVFMPNLTVYHIEEQNRDLTKGTGVLHKIYLGHRSAPPAGWLTVTATGSYTTLGAWVDTWDLTAPPYPLRDGSAYCIFVDQNALDHQPQKTTIITELFRLLAPKGQLFLTTDSTLVPLWRAALPQLQVCTPAPYTIDRIRTQVGTLLHAQQA